MDFPEEYKKQREINGINNTKLFKLVLLWKQEFSYT